MNRAGIGTESCTRGNREGKASIVKFVRPSELLNVRSFAVLSPGERITSMLVVDQAILACVEDVDGGGGENGAAGTGSRAKR